MIDLAVPLAGATSAGNRFEKSAEKIARASFSQTGQGGDSVDLSSEAVALLEARNAFQANLKVVHTADEMTQAALDLVR
jgi:flagellar hook protein FlgE